MFPVVECASSRERRSERGADGRAEQSSAEADTHTHTAHSSDDAAAAAAAVPIVLSLFSLSLCFCRRVCFLPSALLAGSVLRSSSAPPSLRACTTQKRVSAWHEWGDARTDTCANDVRQEALSPRSFPRSAGRIDPRITGADGTGGHFSGLRWTRGDEFLSARRRQPHTPEQTAKWLISSHPRLRIRQSRKHDRSHG